MEDTYTVLHELEESLMLAVATRGWTYSEFVNEDTTQNVTIGASGGGTTSANLLVYDQGSVSDFTVKAGGKVQIAAGCSASSGQLIDGEIILYSGSSAKDITVSGGTIFVQTDAIADNITVTSGTIAAYKNAVLDVKVTGEGKIRVMEDRIHILATSEIASIDNVIYEWSVPCFTLYIDDSVTPGTLDTWDTTKLSNDLITFIDIDVHDIGAGKYKIITFADTDALNTFNDKVHSMLIVDNKKTVDSMYHWSDTYYWSGYVTYNGYKYSIVPDQTDNCFYLVVEDTTETLERIRDVNYDITWYGGIWGAEDSTADPQSLYYVDCQDITVTWEPTSETLEFEKYKVTLKCTDFYSGDYTVYEHVQWIYDRNVTTCSFVNDKVDYKYENRELYHKGSVSVVVYDKAGNCSQEVFTETISNINNQFSASAKWLEDNDDGSKTIKVNVVFNPDCRLDVYWKLVDGYDKGFSIFYIDPADEFVDSSLERVWLKDISVSNIQDLANDEISAEITVTGEAATKDSLQLIVGYYTLGDDETYEPSEVAQFMPYATCICVLADTEAPTTPGNLKTGYTNSQLTLSWDASTDDTGVDHYNVYVDGQLRKSVEGTSVSLDTSNPQHRYNVSACDKEGNESALSADVTLKYIDTTAPTGGTVTVALHDTKEDKLIISASGFTDNDGWDVNFTIQIDGKTVELEDYTPTLGGFTGVYSLATMFTGKVTVKVTATDMSGNAQTVTTEFDVPDIYPPSIPWELAAENGGTRLVWEECADNSWHVSYKVFLDDDTEGIATDTNSLDITDRVLPGSDHTFKVMAYDAAGNSSISKEHPSFHVEDKTAPVAGTVSAECADGQLKLTLSGFSDDSGSIAKYVCTYYDKTSAQEVELECVQSPSGDGVAVYTLPAELLGKTTYYLVASDASGNTSEKIQGEVDVPDRQAPSAPSDLTTEANGLRLAWTASTDNSGKVSYKVYLDGAAEGIATDTNSLDISDRVVPNTDHTYKVEALDAAGNSTTSETLSFHVTDVTGPSGGAASATWADGVLTVTASGYTDDSGVVCKYVFSYYDAATGEETGFTTVESTAAVVSGACQTSAGLTGRLDYYAVAYDACGNASEKFHGALRLDDQTPPTAPTGLAAATDTPSKGDATLTWSASSDNSGAVAGYKVILDGGRSVYETTGCSYILEDVLGEHTATVIAVDAAGNESAASEDCKFEVVDTVAPKAGTLSLSLKSGEAGTVAIKAQGFTDNSGAIASYVFTCDGSEISATITGGDGYGSVEAEIAFGATAIGTKVIGVAAVDAYGNRSAAATGRITLADTQAPDTPAGLKFDEDAMTLNWDACTDNSGKVSYTVYVDNAATGYTTSATSVTAGTLEPGDHVFRVVASDAAGNSSSSEPCQFTLDDFTPPTTGILTAALSRDKRSVTLTGKGFTDDSGVIASYRFFLDGELQDWTGQVQADGTVTLTVTGLEEYAGNITFGLRAVDPDGHIGDMATVVVRVADAKAPTTPANLGAESIGERCATLTWDACTDNSGKVSYYKVYVDGETTGRKVTTNSCKVSGLILSHSFQVEAYDATGNCSGRSAAQTFYIPDVTAPTAGTLSASVLSGYSISVKASGFKDDSGAIESYNVYVNGEKVALGDFAMTSGGFTGVYELAESYAGELKLTVAAVDAAGNVGATASKTFRVRDTQAPSAPSGLSAQAGEDGAAVLSWSASSDNSGAVSYYKVHVDGSARGTKAAGCSLSVAGLSGGAHTFTVEAYDAAGNMSAVSETMAFEVADTTAPTAGKVRAKLSDDRKTVTVTITNFKDDSGAIAEYHFTLNGYAAEKTAAPAAGSYDTTVTFDCDPSYFGNVQIGVTAVDAAGNESAAAKTNIRLADVAAPDKATGLAGATAGAGKAKLTWDVPEDNSGSIAYYMVYIDGETKGRKTTTNSYTAGGLVLEHSFAVVAYDAAGNASEMSDACKFVVDDLTAPVAGTLWARQSDDGASVLLTASSFTDDSGAVASYAFYKGDTLLDLEYTVGDDGVVSATYAIAQADLGKKLTFGVVASDKAGNTGGRATSSLTVRDTVAPAQVANVRASHDESGTVTLTWDASTDNSGSIQHYLVYVDGARTGTMVGGTTLDVAGLSCGAHTFAVSAVDINGNEGAKSESCTDTLPDIAGPTGGRVKAVLDKADRAIVLTAGGFADDSGAVASYVFYEDGVEIGTVSAEAGASAAVLSVAVSEDTLGDVVYSAKALDAAGNESRRVSTRLHVTDVLPPSAPESLAAAVDDEERQAVLTWAASGDNSGKISYYRVYLDGDTRGVKVTGCSYTAKKVVGEHSFAVQAFDAAGNSSAVSASASFTVADTTAPSCGTLKAALSADGRTVQLTASSFADDSGAIADYVFYYGSEAVDIAWSADKTGKSVTAEYRMPDEAQGWAQFGVLAVDRAGNQSRTATAKVKIADIVNPTTPSNLQAAVKSDQSVVLGWDASSDNSGSIKSYKVYVDGDAAGQTATGTTLELRKMDFGQHSYTVVAYDATGNASAVSARFEFEVADTLAPEAGTLSVRQNSQTGEVTVKACNFSDNSGSIAGYTLYIDGEAVDIEWTAAKGVVTATYRPTASGTVEFAVTATDAAGNTSQRASKSLKVSAAAPQTRGGCSELDGYDAADESLMFGDETALCGCALAWDGADAAGCLTGSLESLAGSRLQTQGLLASLG